jgi:hypothetical protein
VTLTRVALLTPFIAYVVIGTFLSEAAHKHMRDPSRGPFWFTPLYEPELFTEEGNRLRIRALRFWLWGGLALVLYVVLV